LLEPNLVRGNQALAIVSADRHREDLPENVLESQIRNFG
jgi:hypothetical protein